ncbi:hypothetical protein GKIL_2787 [Gloeobacter kilaueensis JS1]|uniref:Uncharacterized protein n=1 Tax=Gloeobacter kilaueensis (strain ATCC BAA-2537 / CCAP 1431/1 / ULC 316 / JS1) TaxID=1183438 RepID=U5QJH7_GLOK1|nr:hypothetical protein GKIL_2787 [Gloeobacter kilaueensis JS1]
MNWLNVAMAIVAAGIVLGGLWMVFAGAKAMGDDEPRRR